MKDTFMSGLSALDKLMSFLAQGQIPYVSGSQMGVEVILPSRGHLKFWETFSIVPTGVEKGVTVI